MNCQIKNLCKAYAVVINKESSKGIIKEDANIQFTVTKA